jgi:Ring finger domain
MEELRPRIADLATALGRLAVAYRPQRRLVELRLMSDLFAGTMDMGWRRVDPASQEHADIMRIGDQIRAAHMHDLSPRRWVPMEYMEEAMIMAAIQASLDDVDPTQRLIDNMYDQRFVPDPAAQEDVDRLPVSTVGELGDTCSICLEDMQMGDTHHDLPCGHVMHLACTTEWFRSGTRCPACNVSPFGIKDVNDA